MILVWLKDYSATLAAVVGVVGATVYAAVNVACTAVYAPLGVSPSDVGLDYGGLLAQTGTLLALTVLVAIVMVAPLGVMLWMLRIPARSGHPLLLRLLVWLPVLGGGQFVASVVGGFNGWLVRAAVLALLGLAVVESTAGLKRGLMALFAVIVAIVMVSEFTIGALADAPMLVAGSRTRAFFPGIPLLWTAVVVHVSWARKPASGSPELPACALYLGQSNGVSVFYDGTPGSERTLRLPTSMVLVEVFPQSESALSSEGSARACSPVV